MEVIAPASRFKVILIARRRLPRLQKCPGPGRLSAAGGHRAGHGRRRSPAGAGHGDRDGAWYSPATTAPAQQSPSPSPSVGANGPTRSRRRPPPPPSPADKVTSHGLPGLRRRGLGACQRPGHWHSAWPARVPAAAAARGVGSGAPGQRSSGCLALPLRPCPTLRPP